MTESVTVEVTVTEPSGPTPSAYARGFPKQVPLSAVPERMHLEFEGSRFAVAVAPGVWTRRNPGTTVREDADSGPLLGWCSSVDAFKTKVGRDDPVTCW